MNVLSLFDGISCGRLALNRAGIAYDNYFASEIDKHALSVANRHFPDNIQMGDIRDIDLDSLPKIDLLIGGSPCTGFSVIGKGLNFEDKQSKLFFNYVNIMQKVKPQFFLLENVHMKKEWRDIISGHMGVEPIYINSNLVSAASRRRYYWTNIPNVTIPEDRNIVLGDVWDETDNNWLDGKRLERAHYYSETHKKRPLHKYARTKRDKSPAIIASSSYGLFTKNFQMLFDEAAQKYRFMNDLEKERCMTLPDNYTDGLGKTARAKCIGNGWTVDVVSHIFSFLPKEWKREDALS